MGAGELDLDITEEDQKELKERLDRMYNKLNKYLEFINDIHRSAEVHNINSLDLLDAYLLDLSLMKKQDPVEFSFNLALATKRVEIMMGIFKKGIQNTDGD